MDPQFRRKAHREWFLDGLGYLRIAKERFKINCIGGHTLEYDSYCMIEAWCSNVSEVKPKNHTLMCDRPILMNLK